MKKKRLILSLICNSAITIFGIIAIILQFVGTNPDESDVSSHGIDTFRFFTNDGNMFIILVAIIYIVIDILLLTNKITKTKPIFYILKLASTTSAVIIFGIVMVLLLPMMGPSIISGYIMIILHIVNPILCTISFAFFEDNSVKLNFKKAILGDSPVLIYGAIVMVLCFTKTWTDNEIPYPFLHVYDNAPWLTIIYLIGILGGSIGISILSNYLNNKYYKKAD